MAALQVPRSGLWLGARVRANGGQGLRGIPATDDKTGTLTGGRPVLLEVRAAGRGPGIGPDELLQRAASAEKYSSLVGLLR